MDKVKLYLALALKYHFWILVSLALIIGLVGWGMATGALATYYKNQRAKIDAEFAKTYQITGKPNHPNKSFEEGVDKLLNAPGNGLKASVLNAWDTVYDEQKNKVLKWPVELGDDFLRHVQDKGPTSEIHIDFRERYQNYVKAEFPRLVKIVHAHPYADMTERSGAAAADKDAEKPAEPEVEIVHWRTENQREIDDSLDWPRPPTTKELLYVQEDLWVFHALLDIIARVNETATGRYNAKIKDIQLVAIARRAANEFQAASASGRIYLPAGVKENSAGGGKAPSASSSTGPGGAALAAVQEEGHYVDAKGQPLAAGAAAPPEFKRMPVFLQLVMDQREINRLLAECANSPLPVEVRQVRINPATLRKGQRTVSPSVFGSKKGTATGGMDSGGDLDLGPYDMPVQVFGIIYIYNQPDRTKLDVIGQAPEAPAAEPAAPAEGDKPAAEKPAEKPAGGDQAAPVGEPAAPAAPPAAAPAEAAAPKPPAEPAAPPEPAAPAAK